MKVLVPDHIEEPIRAQWSALSPDIEIIPLAFSERRTIVKRAARAVARRLAPAAANTDLSSAQYDFQIAGQPLAAPRPDIEVLLATWLLGPASFAALRPLLPGLKWIHSTKTGVDYLTQPSIDLSGVQLTCARGVHSERIAEFVTGLVYYFAKRWGDHAAMQRHGKFEELPPALVHGQRALVLGTGSIGAAVARLLRANGLHVDGINHSGRATEPFENVFQIGALPAQIVTADYVIIALPLTQETHGLLNATLLRSMKERAVLINIARDEIVDETALLEVLKSGRISAALEITRPGGLPRAHPFNRLPNVLVTHYSAWSGGASNREIAERFGLNLLRFAAGEPLLGVADPARGY